MAESPATTVPSSSIARCWSTSLISRPSINRSLRISSSAAVPRVALSVRDHGRRRSCAPPRARRIVDDVVTPCLRLGRAGRRSAAAAPGCSRIAGDWSVSYFCGRSRARPRSSRVGRDLAARNTRDVGMSPHLVHRRVRGYRVDRAVGNAWPNVREQLRESPSGPVGSTRGGLTPPDSPGRPIRRLFRYGEDRVRSHRLSKLGTLTLIAAEAGRSTPSAKLRAPIRRPCSP